MYWYRKPPSGLKQNDTARDYAAQRLIPSNKWEE
jgi:hypothetical protein